MIALSSRDSRPLQQQVAESLRRLLTVGAFASGEALPSPGEMASALAVNPSAVWGAYRTLEGEGYLKEGEDGRFLAPEDGTLLQGEKARLLKGWDQTTLELLSRRLITRKELETRLREVKV